MKKFLAIILCLAALLSLTACGKDDQGEDILGEEYFEDVYTPDPMEDVEHIENVDDQEDGLPVVDPFEDVELQFLGKNGTGAVYDVFAYIPDADGEIHQTRLKYEAENDGELSNGDLVHVFFNQDVSMESRETDFGVHFSRAEADIPVYGLHVPDGDVTELGEKATVNLNDYVTVGCEGSSDGLGSAYVKIDYEKILRDNIMSLNVNVAEEDLLGAYSPWGTVHSMFFDSSTYPILPTIVEERYDYKNGDTVQVTWQINEKQLAYLKKVFNVDFTYSDFSFTVEGLEAPAEVDPFEDYEIIYSGNNGEATATKAYIYVRPEPNFKVGLKVEVIAENNGKLSNGDKIVISIAQNLDEFMNETGCTPTRTEMEVEVEGLS